MREQKIAIKKEELLGEKLKALRLYSPEKYKNFIKTSGYSPRSFLRWENGESGMNTVFIKKLADEYGAEYGDMIRFLTDKDFDLESLIKSGGEKYTFISESTVVSLECSIIYQMETKQKKPCHFAVAKNRFSKAKKCYKETPKTKKEEREELIATCLFILYVAVFSCIIMVIVIDACSAERAISDDLYAVFAILSISATAILIAVCRKKLVAFLNIKRENIKKKRH